MDNLGSVIFNLTGVIHIFVWVFVLFAFTNKKLAYLNIFYVVPIIYLLHILPFHILMEIKKKSNPKNWEDDTENIYKILILPDIFVMIQKYLDKRCTFNPISPQGMLIFGLISSIYVLNNNKSIIAPNIIF